MPDSDKQSLSNNVTNKPFYIHLVSDSTGTTLHGLARACLAQFDETEPVEKFWNMIRSEKQVDIVIKGIEAQPGPVIFTLVDPNLRRRLKQGCHKIGVPCNAVLDPLIRALSHHLGKKPKGMPGLQHQMDKNYFDRIDAVEFSLHHDDGKIIEGLDEADVILVGVSRTSKTPTCMYLANRGVRAANIPLVPNVPFPEEVAELAGPLFIGLTENPKRLTELRRNRLSNDQGELDLISEKNQYLSEDAITDEIRRARKLFSKYGWPVIDVTSRSVEETSAEILMLLSRYKN